MHFLLHAVTQISKLPETRQVYASTHAVHFDTIISDMFPTFAFNVLSAEPSILTEATLLAYSTYTVFANTLGSIYFYIPNHHQTVHQVKQFPFMTLYHLVRAMHITMRIQPRVTSPDVVTPQLLSDWIFDLQTIISSQETNVQCYAPSLFTQVPYTDVSEPHHLRMPLNMIHPATHRMILCSVHAILQPIIGTVRPHDRRILYKCQRLCLHKPNVYFERDSVSDHYYRVSIDLTTQFASAHLADPYLRETPHRRRFNQLLQSLPIETRAHILNYHIENTQTLDCSQPSTPQTTSSKTSFLRCSNISLDSITRTLSPAFAEFFVHVRNTHSHSRNNSISASAYGQTYPSTRVHRVQSPVSPTFQDMHLPPPRQSMIEPINTSDCQIHGPILKDIHWIS